VSCPWPASHTWALRAAHRQLAACDVSTHTINTRQAPRGGLLERSPTRHTALHASRPELQRVGQTEHAQASPRGWATTCLTQLPPRPPRCASGVPRGGRQRPSRAAHAPQISAMIGSAPSYLPTWPAAAVDGVHSWLVVHSWLWCGGLSGAEVAAAAEVAIVGGAERRGQRGGGSIPGKERETGIRPAALLASRPPLSDALSAAPHCSSRPLRPLSASPHYLFPSLPPLLTASPAAG